MNTDSEINRVTELVIGAAYRVGSALQFGYLEKVYENALAHEIAKLGLRVEQQYPVPVWYDGVKVGEYFADLIVEGWLLVELKSGKAIDEAHKAQCLNYLTCTGLRLCLLINFGPSVQIKRLRR